jgi:hypothetical protein
MMSTHRPSAWMTCAVLGALFAVCTPARAQFADGVLWYNTSNLAFTVGELEITLQGLGAPYVDDTDVWPGSLATYRLVFLVLPDADFDPGQIADIEAFLASGGLLVTVADNDNYDDEADRLNALLAQLGLDSFHTDGMYDPTCPHTATAVPGNPLMDGVGTFQYAASSEVVAAGGGEELATGQSGQTLLVYESGVVLSADSGPFTDWCGNISGNSTLWENLFSGWCDMDGDGHDKAICGGGDCDDTDPAINPDQAEVADGLDNDCNGVADDGMMPAGALIITEIMKNPDAVSDTAGEWFEVYNTLGSDLNLLGLEVTDAGTNSFVVDTDLWIAPGQHLVLGRHDDPAVNGGVTLDYLYTNFQLGNTGADEVFLTHGGVLLDEVVYDDVDWPDTAGVAMSLDPPLYDATDNDDFTSWCNAVAPYGAGDRGSPGALNPTCCGDADGDGFADATCGGDDCDDADPAIFPGASEVVCDGVDNDCDAATEDEPDDDADGFSVCVDCDDMEPLMNPGEGENECDGLDNDCDPATEDEPDADGDGVPMCDDCDDTDPAAYPGGTEIECDGVDNDCDPATEDEPDGDGDGSSACVDCDDGDAAIYPGAVEDHDGIDNDCDGLTDEGALTAGALVITEVLRDPDAVTDSDGEWFEVYNNTAVEMNLMGLWVYDLGSDEFTVEEDLLLAAGEYAVLGRSGDAAVNGGVTVAYEYEGFSLGNTDDEIVLEHGGVVLDQIEFDSGWPDTAGYAMNLDPSLIDATANDDPASWCDAPYAWDSGDFGSPGEENDICCSDGDGDGFDDAACGGDDCDDGDADVSPDADEDVCDGVDNDCDEETPDEPDLDGDGVSTCDDCDDEDDEIYPDAPELCDGVDNDCDGQVDEGLDCDPADDDDTGDDDTDDDDAGDDDTGDDDDDTGDCNCRTAGGRTGHGAPLALFLAAAWIVRRRGRA